MYCTVKPVREKKQHYKPRYGEPLIADMGDKELTIIVNWPVLNCNVCEGKESKFTFNHDAQHMLYLNLCLNMLFVFSHGTISKLGMGNLLRL